MSQVFAPFGFQPRFHPSGTANPRTQGGQLPTPPTYTYPCQMPVSLDPATGFLVPAVVFGPTPATNEVSPVAGIFYGVQYSQPTGFVKQDRIFYAGTPTFNSSAPSVNQGDVYNTWVFPQIYQDPQMEFYVQANGPLTKAALGQTFDIDVATIQLFNASSGYSRVALNATPAPDGSGNFIVTELAVKPELGGSNQWGDPFTVVLVKFNSTNF